ncbi:SANT/Myb_domain [Hexamita inflata]|uniref:SANT/Myb domain n=1 Tax=Hexamita inflata TaxID=28002 RepID=A0AA86PP56_9EUKA|nr:SANT/Myb domain [Hexamita inflata]
MFNEQLIHVHLLLEINEVQNLIKQHKIMCRKKQQPRIKEDNRCLRWTKEEDQLLVDQIGIMGIQNYKQINIPSKSTQQVYFRIRYLSNVVLQNKELYLNKTDLDCFKL